MKHVIKIQILCSLACFCMFLVGCKDQTTTAETNAKSSAQAETKSQSQKDLKMACLRTCSEKYQGIAAINACQEYETNVNSLKCQNNSNNPSLYNECIQKYQKLHRDCKEKYEKLYFECFSKC